ncbi:MAG TPA: helix-turn-helix domain-containing protein [Janthinobacterium sp.]|nr:helix-turn-helix domain-containing protein [Janthinobacterium sp.]
MNSERAEQPQPRDGKPATPGAQMRAQREALGWSVEQAAEQLKLAPRQVGALEAGDYASLPNPAVVRGFIRAYAKILKLDAAPLVATIAITPADNAEVMPTRALSASFSESRFPSMTQRSSKPTGWIIAAVVILAAAALGAYEMGYISPALLMRGDRNGIHASASADGGKPADSAAPAAAADVAPAKPQDAPLQTPSVPLISVPSSAGADTPAATPAAAAATVSPAAAPEPAPAPAAAAPAAGANPLVLTVRQDSWIEIRRKSGAPLISRIVMAGSTETFDISEPVLLVVGKPGGVDVTLRGAAVELAPVPGGTTARLNLK